MKNPLHGLLSRKAGAGILPHMHACGPELIDGPSFAWSDALLLGFAPMDRTHEEFYETAFALYTCTAASALDAVSRFERHARAHFGEEEAWMRSTAFPSEECHRQEHAAVLQSVAAVKQAIESGRAAEQVAHDLALSLLNWFPAHADYMDSALAAWMVQRLHGGRPVVLRRTIASSIHA